MLGVLSLFFCVWLMVKIVRLALKLTWGAVKLTAGILVGLALPLAVVCFAFIGGAAVLLPLVLLGLAAGILGSCTS